MWHVFQSICTLYIATPSYYCYLHTVALIFYFLALCTCNEYTVAVDTAKLSHLSYFEYEWVAVSKRSAKINILYDICVILRGKCRYTK